MDVKLLFIDDCLSNKLPNCRCRISSLTGILLTPEQCQQVREALLKIMHPISKVKNGVITLNPKELHGSDFLRSEPDGMKIEIYSRLSRLPFDFDFDVYRVGIYLTNYFKSIFKADDRGLGLLWFNLLTALQQQYEQSLLIPIMDGFNQDFVERFSGVLNSSNHLGSILGENVIGLTNYKNILTECLFVDSKYSYLTQLADVISYLRNINDQKAEGCIIEGFKKQLFELNQNLGSCIKFDEIVEYNVRVVNRITNTYRNVKKI